MYKRQDLKPGPVVDTQGNIVGRHKGIAYYTIGQRQGLGIARGYPVYITRIDPKTNKIFICTKEDASQRELLARDLHFAISPIKKKIALKVKIRYNHKEAEARLIPFGNKTTGYKVVVWLPIAKAKIIFKKPQFAITPGQSAVFYSQGRVLGGAIIDKVIK